MTDKEILDIVYGVLKASQEADMGVDTDQIVKEQVHFIEQEWQKRDEAKAAAAEMMNVADEIFGDTTFSKHWYKNETQ